VITQLRKRGSFKFWVGIAFTALAVLMLVAVIFWFFPGANIDFPCEWFGYPRSLTSLDMQVAYCLSYWPHYAISGGAIYAYGASNESRIVLSPQAPWYGNLILERQGQVLIVNDQPLQSGETYSTFRWFPTLNPWLLSTAHFTVKNEGMLGKTIEGSRSPTAIYVSGDVREGWLPNPIGFMILGVGVMLLVSGVRQRKSTM
jgi:hypothetical protein